MLARVRKDVPRHDTKRRTEYSSKNYESMCMFSSVKSLYSGEEHNFYEAEGEPGFYWLDGTPLLFHKDWLEFDKPETVITDEEAFIGEDQ